MGSLNPALGFLVETAAHLYLLALLMRVLLEFHRADFYNPVVQFLVQVTNPVIGPLSKVLPRSKQVNVAALVAMYLIQLASLLALVALSGRGIDLMVLMVVSITQLVRLLLTTYLVLIIISVILSWVGHGLRHPVIPLVYQLVDPVLVPIRRVLPSLGGLDLSPLVAIVGIQFLMILLGL
ncbi:MAG: YggT family protein [Wenzhouxiangella sp.]|nr:YggT family protein [Wenzhouxiangella sp.]MDR9453106.1 YggT family protein [Wenzhouxiangella sp.]